MIIEACVENFGQSYNAFKQKADRLELCDNLAVGGTTPSLGTIKMCQTLNIPIFVMIRPRGGNFVYSPEEIEIMLEDIAVCKQFKVAGVVFGCLNADNSINYSLNKKLVQAAGNLNIIFHRAIDYVANPWQEVEKLADIGITNILSAGGTSSFANGLATLKKLLEQCNKFGIALTAAGQITKENLQEYATLLPAPAFHGKLIVGDLS